MKGEPFVKRLIVTSCEEHAVWKTSSNKDSVLYEIKANDEDGKPWMPDVSLRSFAELVLDVPQDYTCEHYTNPKNGEKSITIKRPRQNTTQRVEFLENQVRELAERISALETRLPAADAGGLPEMPRGPWGVRT